MTTIRAVAGILWRDDKFLAVERPAGKIMAGFWEFPGGKIEQDETPQEALRRELKEELGVDARDARFWRTLNHAYEHGVITLHLFHIPKFSGEPRPLENQKLQWVVPVEALRLNFLPADLPVVEELAASSSSPQSTPACD